MQCTGSMKSLDPDMRKSYGDRPAKDYTLEQLMFEYWLKDEFNYDSSEQMPHQNCTADVCEAIKR